MGAIINEKIIGFAAKNSLSVLGQYGRDRKAREVKNYTISTDRRIVLGRIKPDCTYEEFLEVVASRAISEIERLYCVNEEIWQTNDELCKELESIRAKN